MINQRGIVPFGSDPPEITLEPLALVHEIVTYAFRLDFRAITNPPSAAIAWTHHFDTHRYYTGAGYGIPQRRIQDLKIGSAA